MFKPIDAQELLDPKKVSAAWVKNLNSIVERMNNTKSLTLGMKPKYATKLSIFKPDKSKNYPEDALTEDGPCIYLYQPVERDGVKKRYTADFT